MLVDFPSRGESTSLPEDGSFKQSHQEGSFSDGSTLTEAHQGGSFTDDSASAWSSFLRVEAEQDVASGESVRVPWTGFFAALMLMTVSACALLAFVAQDTPKPSHLGAETAFNAVVPGVLGDATGTHTSLRGSGSPGYAPGLPSIWPVSRPKSKSQVTAQMQRASQQAPPASKKRQVEAWTTLAAAARAASSQKKTRKDAMQVRNKAAFARLEAALKASTKQGSSSPASSTAKEGHVEVILEDVDQDGSEHMSDREMERRIGSITRWKAFIINRAKALDTLRQDIPQLFRFEKVQSCKSWIECPMNQKCDHCKVSYQFKPQHWEIYDKSLVTDLHHIVSSTTPEMLAFLQPEAEDKWSLKGLGLNQRALTKLRTFSHKHVESNADHVPGSFVVTSNPSSGIIEARWRTTLRMKHFEIPPWLFGPERVAIDRRELTVDIASKFYLDKDGHIFRHTINKFDFVVGDEVLPSLERDQLLRMLMNLDNSPHRTGSTGTAGVKDSVKESSSQQLTVSI